jgi:hypothetical protein
MANEKLILDLEAIADNPSNIVDIYVGGFAFNSVKGFNVSDFRFGGGNDYNTPLDNDLLSNISAAASSNNTGVSTTTNFIIKSQLQTVLQWTGSDRFGFTVDLLFLSWKRNDKKVLTPIKQLLAAVNPVSTGKAGIDLTGLSLGLDLQTIAPLNYTTYSNKSTLGIPISIGTSSIKVGKWFAADQLVIKKVDFTVSKEFFDDGKPLYATASIQMETFKMLSAFEVLKFILMD